MLAIFYGILEAAKSKENENLAKVTLKEKSVSENLLRSLADFWTHGCYQEILLLQNQPSEQDKTLHNQKSSKGIGLLWQQATSKGLTQ